MSGHTIPTADGRSVLIRPCLSGEGVQLGIVGKRRSLVEAVSFDPSQLPGLLGSLEQAAEEAQREFAENMEVAESDLLDRLAAAEAAANATHCPEGHRLSPANSFHTVPGKGCRTCRREGNFWYRRERGLA